MIEPIIKATDGHFGFAITTIGVGASLLTFLDYLTPLVGSIAALIGLYAAMLTLKIKLSQWKLWEKEHPESKKYNQFEGDVDRNINKENTEDIDD
jgi:hypothetical protein